MKFTIVRSDGSLCSLGRLVYTPGAAALIGKTRGGAKKVASFIYRHAEGDCPTMDPADQELNRKGVESNGYLMTAWNLVKDDRPLWIITEHDRSATTILTPDEY